VPDAGGSNDEVQPSVLEKDPGDRLSEELALLESATRALDAGQYDEAEARSAEHRRRFPAGMLIEERERILILALAKLGRRDEAVEAWSAFRRRFPNSVYRDALSRALEE
jgi:outer membrane protein assembly factor BamD (BamD/ComL family)